MESQSERRFVKEIGNSFRLKSCFLWIEERRTRWIPMRRAVYEVESSEVKSCCVESSEVKEREVWGGATGRWQYIILMTVLDSTLIRRCWVLHQLSPISLVRKRREMRRSVSVSRAGFQSSRQGRKPIFSRRYPIEHRILLNHQLPLATVYSPRVRNSPLCFWCVGVKRYLSIAWNFSVSFLGFKTYRSKRRRRRRARRALLSNIAYTCTLGNCKL